MPLERTLDLSFYLADPRNDASARAVAPLLSAAARIAWPLGVPVLVDDVEEIDADSGETEREFQQRGQVAAIISESANNILWPVKPSFPLPSAKVERRRPSTPIERRLVGGRVLLHDQRDPEDVLPSQLDRQEYEAVEHLFRLLEEFAATYQATWEIIFGDEDIGRVTPSGCDASITKGLLEPWKSAIAAGEA